MKIATWNVNSLKVRLPQVLAWLGSEQPDVLCLQETKLADARFPVAELADAGYRALYHGQPTYNGVAILSRNPPSDVRCDWPDGGDGQARLCAASFGDLRVVNVYVPNGQALDSDKYPYKLQWLERLRGLIAGELQGWPQLLLVGDFNIAPDARDVYDAADWGEGILCSAPERAALGALLELGLHDSYRKLHPDARAWSWWDYRAAAFRRNQGLRIDLILASSPVLSRTREVVIDRAARAAERPSDHAPVCITLESGA
ncbi:exodeoxyribonuclease III [Acidithiobacillus sp. 'AMD consortium']|uniref:Exodeoxyribonuclease III n=1 Tax=Acidithiobacillus ferridurans TaxID=1232575 RepID=A0A8X8KBU3_ACIFI|nr:MULTISPECIES: exodeoxyribonuclease III [Acidithiobacillus]MBU2716035.1 exodeoxyribonuclease III [Acidithiobacillus ferridurans]MBU2718343.1 exodeoxyribonuclease III [Acidithiobacillus ferridurans]MBU2722859.1 exodeoxyribonuclease III [Acidithiobacillus ferridurans]MBU2725406.1 exodeoxyribonuclease III [Acidithiobacillus ferridurans]MBU2804280.1 exodeoxyribonuclease III [Acidithiobacillus ferridurans]